MCFDTCNIKFGVELFQNNFHEQNHKLNNNFLIIIFTVNRLHYRVCNSKSWASRINLSVSLTYKAWCHLLIASLAVITIGSLWQKSVEISANHVKECATFAKLFCLPWYWSTTFVGKFPFASSHLWWHCNGYIPAIA